MDEVQKKEEQFKATFDDVSEQNLFAFADTTPDQKVNWLWEMLQFLQKQKNKTP
jgi:hypothetical protein